MRVELTSSNLKAVDYDSVNHALLVEFVSGQRYTYFAVPPTVYAGLLNAESAGRYFSRHIRHTYKWVKEKAA